MEWLVAGATPVWDTVCGPPMRPVGNGKKLCVVCLTYYSPHLKAVTMVPITERSRIAPYAVFTREAGLIF